MNKRLCQVSIPICKAKEIGFKAVEKEAKQKLKKMYPKDKWAGAKIVADVVGNYLVYTMDYKTVGYK